MKNSALIGFGVFILFSCNQTKTSDGNGEEKSKEEIMAGGDKDEHGCIGSAGYSWSEVRQECIRLFESAERMIPVDKNTQDTTLSAFILVSEDKSKAELFLPQDTGSVILDKYDENLFKNDSYSFNYTDCSLMMDGQLRYRGE